LLGSDRACGRLTHLGEEPKGCGKKQTDDNTGSERDVEAESGTLNPYVSWQFAEERNGRACVEEQTQCK
jgi:hypothetical protein